MAAGPLAELRAELGEESVAEHPPLELAGCGIGLTWRPADAASLAHGLAALGRRGLAALIRGGGNRLSSGNPPSRADVLLSTEALRGVEEFDPDEGVCRARAGTTLSELRATVGPAGWELPLDAPGAGATLGGVLAAAAEGPRAQGFGRPRDVVLGLEVSLASGERTRCGGRVVKNVTGYDLNKLYTGSWGALGVIEAAWLRLCPRPERVAFFELELPEPGAAARAAVEASRLASSRAAALDAPAAGASHLVVELAGPEPAVERDAGWLRGAGAREVDASALDALRRAACPDAGAAALRFRLALLPSGLDAGLSRLRAAGAWALVTPGLGVARAVFPLPGAEGANGAVEAAFRCAADVARPAGGGFVLESGPDRARAGRDAFGGPGAAPSLVRALKARFDPAGVLNPGRLAGGV